MNVVRQIESRDKPAIAELTLEDFRTLDEAGAFEQRKVELIEGVLYQVAPQQIRHSRLKFGLGVRLREALVAMGSPLETFVEVTIAMPSKSAPEPDIVLAADQEGDDYALLSAVALVVEVSNTTYRFDRGEKLALYASNGIPEYWIADLKRERIEQFWAPEGSDYRESCAIPFGERVESRTIPGLAIDTSGLV